MTGTFTLSDSLALDDLDTFLQRASRVENGSVRLIAGDHVLAVYVAVLYPVGLLDETPTILGLRIVSLPGDERFDVVVPSASLLARVAAAREAIVDPTAPVELGVPAEVHTVTWAALSPPRGGWAPLEPVDPETLERVARAGIDEVAASVPESTGEQLVRRVRGEVWGRPMRGSPHIPAGAGFAALTLGFLGDEDEVAVYETGPWTRLTTRGGHVLVKRRAWSLAR
jgi:hypothetical protein